MGNYWDPWTAVFCLLVGSLATSLTDPWTLLCGASGGCYALIGAHFAAIFLVFSSHPREH